MLYMQEQMGRMEHTFNGIILICHGWQASSFNGCLDGHYDFLWKCASKKVPGESKNTQDVPIVFVLLISSKLLASHILHQAKNMCMAGSSIPAILNEFTPMVRLGKRWVK